MRLNDMILKTIYPNKETNIEVIITSSMVGILLYVFLVMYQPFGTGNFEHSYKYLILFPYAIITAFSFSAAHVLLRNKKRKWTVGSELFKTIMALFFISSLSYFYNTLFVSKVYFSFENYLYMLAYASALGFPVAIIYILARYIYYNSKNNPSAKTASDPDIYVDPAKSAARLLILSENTQVTLEIDEKDFIYAESADNYCIIHYYDKGILKKEIIRLSLTRLLDQIQTDAIKKVHRSWIVNLKKVTRFKGNTSGYKISVAGIEKELSISRNYIDAVVPVLKLFANRP